MEGDGVDGVDVGYVGLGRVAVAFEGEVEAGKLLAGMDGYGRCN